MGKLSLLCLRLTIATTPAPADYTTVDLFHPKMSPTLSFSGMYRKSFIHRRNRRDSFPKTAMHIYAIRVFAWMRRYAVSIYVFLIRIHFDGHLRRPIAILWTILRIQKPYKHIWSVSFRTWLFIDTPDGPGRISNGLRAYLYIAPPTHLPIIDLVALCT